MPNRNKIVLMGCIAAFSLGSLAMFQPESSMPEDVSSVPRLAAIYAAPLERVETHVLGRGQTVTSLLARAAGLTAEEAADALLTLRKHVEPRQVTTGAEITIRRWMETDRTRGVDVQLDADRTVRLSKNGKGWKSAVVMTPVKVDTIYSGGVIGAGKTLYEAIVMDVQSRVVPQERYRLVNELASIYEYKLDFTREIQPGDSYRVVYERQVRPDGTARTSRVLAAEVVTRGVTYPAIYNDAGGYYDDQGRSLATGFLKYPVAYARITSNFNPRRYHPVRGGVRAHQGTDFGAATGTEVRAVADGTVTYAGFMGGYGRVVDIKHANGYMTRYAHLSAFGRGIRVGARVTQKQMIGRVGATGLATGPHLHYELRHNGRPVNAMAVRLPGAPALSGEARQLFLSLAQQRSTLLQRFGGGSTSQVAAQQPQQVQPQQAAPPRTAAALADET
jgi:murein DD-endopeptidase MepM/ murein hydrolase activator NlpD